RLLCGPEVLFNIGLRAQQSLLFSAPQSDANGPSRLDADRLENACRFHHYRAADGVIGGAGGGMPGIEVTSKHDNFVSLVAAFDFGNGVVRRSSFRERSVHD